MVINSQNPSTMIKTRESALTCNSGLICSLYSDLTEWPLSVLSPDQGPVQDHMLHWAVTPPLSLSTWSRSPALLLLVTSTLSNSNGQSLCRRSLDLCLSAICSRLKPGHTFGAGKPQKWCCVLWAPIWRWLRWRQPGFSIVKWLFFPLWLRRIS